MSHPLRLVSFKFNLPSTAIVTSDLSMRFKITARPNIVKKNIILPIEISWNNLFRVLEK